MKWARKTEAINDEKVRRAGGVLPALRDGMAGYSGLGSTLHAARYFLARVSGGVRRYFRICGKSRACW